MRPLTLLSSGFERAYPTGKILPGLECSADRAPASAHGIDRLGQSSALRYFLLALPDAVLAGAGHRLRPLDQAPKRTSDPPFAARTKWPAGVGPLAVTYNSSEDDIGTVFKV